jgi:hypothetical protein
MTLAFPIEQRFSSRLSLVRLDVNAVYFCRSRCSSGAVTRGYASHFLHELVSGFQIHSYLT